MSLREFLKKEGLFESFTGYIRKRAHFWGVTDENFVQGEIKEALRENDMKVFNWAETEEGYDFWCGVYDKFWKLKMGLDPNKGWEEQ